MYGDLLPLSPTSGEPNRINPWRTNPCGVSRMTQEEPRARKDQYDNETETVELPADAVANVLAELRAATDNAEIVRDRGTTSFNTSAVTAARASRNAYDLLAAELEDVGEYE